MKRVAVFTDSYLPTVNGVTYTVTAWRERWAARGGRMDVVYPGAEGHEPREGEFPVRSVPFPLYEGYRIGVPRIPAPSREADLVHVHTPFSLGVAGLRLARRASLPVVASYHTPIGEYTDYLAPTGAVADAIRPVGEWWERWFLDRADRVLAPSTVTADRLREDIGVETPIEVLSNGVDVDLFRAVDADAFRAEHGLEGARPLVGYTGRHGYEKRLDVLVDAAAGLDVTLVFGGDGPARADLERRAAEQGVDARFLGFLDRDSLPAFYSALDVFAFPSPVETEGIVALESIACGTPVVGADRGALAETIDDGVTGFHFESGDPAALRRAIERALGERERLAERCRGERDAISVEDTVDRLAELYDSL